MERINRLDWPPGWRRTVSRKPAAFDTSLERAISSLSDEIRMLGGKNARLTHAPFRSGADPHDPGVAVYFDLKNDRKVFACDRWQRVRDNVRAIALTIGALRGIGRWGASDMLERAFTGFDALPPPPSCWQVLGLEPGANADVVNAAYRKLVAQHHPDKPNGSHSRMAEINAARDDALRQLGG